MLDKLFETIETLKARIKEHEVSFVVRTALSVLTVLVWK